MAETSRYDLFLRISQNLKVRESSDLRTYVEGNKLLPARDLEHMDPQQIFLKLEHGGQLGKGDLSLLVDLMTKIKRDDFAQEAKGIAAQERKVSSDSFEDKSRDDTGSSQESSSDEESLNYSILKTSEKIFDEEVIQDLEKFESMLLNFREHVDAALSYLSCKAKLRVKRRAKLLVAKVHKALFSRKELKSKYDKMVECFKLYSATMKKLEDGCVLCTLEFDSPTDLKSFLRGYRDGKLSETLTQELITEEMKQEGGPDLYVHVTLLVARHKETSGSEPPNQERMKREAEPEGVGDLEAPADKGDGKIDVKVKSCDEDFWEKIKTEKDLYRMDSKPRGYALILNNKIFEAQLGPRKGSDVDLINIAALLEGLSFETHILEDKKAQEIKDELLAFSRRKEHKQVDCCVVVLMSHGDEGVIFGTDHVSDGGGVQLDEIFTMFDNKNCPRLMGKPKLFFIQACRGTKFYKGEADSPGPDIKVDLAREMRNLLHLPEDESVGPDAQHIRPDMLCGYATQLGYVSFINQENGSWFIQAITKVFMEHAKDKSLTEMMPMVIEDVSNRTVSRPGHPSHGAKENAEFDHSLLKPLYFFPGVE